MRDRRSAYRVLMRRPEGRRPFENLGMDVIFKKWDGET
jgi:hypothetical protein